MSASKRRLLVAGVGLAAAGLGLGWALRRQLSQPTGEDVVDSAPAPADLWRQRFETPDGGEIALAAFRGRPLVLNFWATWCAPCILELPEFSAKYNLFKQNGATILAVNAAEKEPVVQDFAKRSKLAFPLMVDTAGTTKRAYGVTALPVTLIIDRNGIVRDKIGDESSAAQLIARMQAAAKKAS